MKKNVASQVVGAQMVSATDGSAFTGSVTVSVTGNGGTQATGSVGSGACTHEGNGFHSYAPAQAETNYDHVAFTFTGTGAIPVTVQIYPTFPQTGDSFALIGSTGSGLTSLASQASVNTVDDFLDTEIAAIKAKTDNLPASPANEATLTTIAGYIDTEVAAIKAKTDNLPASPANEATLTTIAGYIDTEVAAIKAKTDNLPASPAAVGSAMTLTSGERDSVADALLDRSSGIETSLTLRGAIRLILAAAAGKLSGAASSTVTIRNVGDTKARITATVDADGNRSAVTTDAT